MSHLQPVGKFKFGWNTIEADITGTFTMTLFNGGEWKFDVGEINRIERIIQRVSSGHSKPTEEHPVAFWRTSGSKVIEVYLRKGFWSNDFKYIVLREGGTRKGYFWISEASLLLRHLGTLIKEAPYHRAVQLLDVVEEEREEKLILAERFPLDNRQSQTPLRVEKEFTKEIIKTVNVEASLGIGVDYYIQASIESRFGLAKEQRISETIKITMEAKPGVHKEYIINWTEITTRGYAILEVSGVRERIPFRLKSGLVPSIHQRMVVQD